MEQAIFQGIFGVLNFSGLMRRGVFWTFLTIVFAIEVFFHFVLMALTSYEGVFSYFLGFVVLCNVLMAFYVLSAMTKRVRDAGGNAMMPVALLLSIGMLFWLYMDRLMSPAFSDVSNAWEWEYFLSQTSVAGFSCAVILMLILPSHRRQSSFSLFEEVEEEHVFSERLDLGITSNEQKEVRPESFVFKSSRGGFSD
jgi:uncharacterized membrane protein YhaH (DUF805 family)